MKTATITIKLTNARPVTIDKNDWPVCASACYSWFDGEFECQANRTRDGFLEVRTHEDGRILIFARANTSSNWRGEGDTHSHAGIILGVADDRSDDSVIQSILTVAIDCADGSAEWEHLAADCIADLPAEVI